MQLPLPWPSSLWVTVCWEQDDGGDEQQKTYFTLKCSRNSRFQASRSAGSRDPLKCCPRPVKALDSDYRARVILSYCYCGLGKSSESHIIRYFVSIPATCEHTLSDHRFTRGVKSVPVAPNSDRWSLKTPSLGYLRTALTLAHTVKDQWKSESLHFKASSRVISVEEHGDRNSSDPSQTYIYI